MTKRQPEGSETTRDAMEEDVIEESAFEVKETDQYAQRASAKSFTNVNKRKAPASQSKSNRKAKTFSWSTEKVEILLRYIKEYKSNCDFKGIDFEADLATISLGPAREGAPTMFELCM